MKILPLYSYQPFINKTQNQPTFEARKELIDLNYVMEKRAYLLPPRVKAKVATILARPCEKLPTLKEVHQALYAPLADCKTLEEAQGLFPEFKDVNDVNIRYQRRTINSELITEDIKKDLALKCLKAFWCDLKTKDEIAGMLGMCGRNTLEWTLKKMNFVSYPSNYKTLLMSSDPETQKIIADKVRAWKAAHPDLMRAHNKHAAQFTKTPEYREAHSKRMYEYDKEHPERKEKISAYYKKVWELCPDIKKAMSDFAIQDSPYVRAVVLKKIQGGNLTEAEKRVDKGFYNRFWKTYPEYKEIYRTACHQVTQESKSKK